MRKDLTFKCFESKRERVCVRARVHLERERVCVCARACAFRGREVEAGRMNASLYKMWAVNECA